MEERASRTVWQDLLGLFLSTDGKLKVGLWIAILNVYHDHPPFTFDDLSWNIYSPWLRTNKTLRNCIQVLVRKIISWRWFSLDRLTQDLARKSREQFKSISNRHSCSNLGQYPHMPKYAYYVSWGYPIKGLYSQKLGGLDQALKIRIEELCYPFVYSNFKGKPSWEDHKTSFSVLTKSDWSWQVIVTFSSQRLTL